MRYDHIGSYHESSVKSFFFFDCLCPLLLLCQYLLFFYSNRMLQGVLREKNRVSPMLMWCAGYASLVKMKEARERGECFHAKVVARSTTGTAWKIGLSIEVSCWSKISYKLQISNVFIDGNFFQISFIGVHGHAPLAEFVR